MKVIIDIPDTDIPKRQDILSIDLCFIDGQVGQCTYPFEVLQERRALDEREISYTPTHTVWWPKTQDHK